MDPKIVDRMYPQLRDFSKHELAEAFKSASYLDLASVPINQKAWHVLYKQKMKALPLIALDLAHMSGIDGTKATCLTKRRFMLVPGGAIKVIDLATLQEGEFIMFPAFPIEVRAMIFVQALHPRTIRAVETIDRTTGQVNYRIFGATRPTIFKVSREARTAVQLAGGYLYEALFALKTSSANKVFFNSNLDTLVITSVSPSVNPHNPLGNTLPDVLAVKEDLHRVRKLAINFKFFMSRPSWFRYTLAAMPNLQVLQLAVHLIDEVATEVRTEQMEFVWVPKPPPVTKIAKDAKSTAVTEVTDSTKNGTGPTNSESPETIEDTGTGNSGGPEVAKSVEVTKPEIGDYHPARRDGNTTLYSYYAMQSFRDRVHPDTVAGNQLAALERTLTDLKNDHIELNMPKLVRLIWYFHPQPAITLD